MSLLPSSPDITPDSEPRVVGLHSEEADDLMAALSSTTARRILAEVHDDPAPPGELANRVDTSLQNVQYHLNKLKDAGAIEVVGTAYSEKGREMSVYGPADSPLVIFAGEEERASGLRTALSRLFGGFAALAVGALTIQELFGESVILQTGDDAAAPSGATATPTPSPTADGDAAGNGNGADPGGDGGGDPPTATETPTDDADVATSNESSPEEIEATGTPTEEAIDVAATPTPGSGADFEIFDAVQGIVESGMPPGLAFFLGGAVVLCLVMATTYVRTRP